MARFAAAKDRLDVMLFVVMSVNPVLQQLSNPGKEGRFVGHRHAADPIFAAFAALNYLELRS